MDRLDELIEEIQSRTIARRFEIPISDILEILDWSIEEYYRFRYEKRQRQTFGDLSDSFSPEDIPELMDLMEACHVDRVQERMESAGLYFRSETLLDFQDFFVSVILNRIRSHKVDQDLLETSLSACADPEDGYRFYIDACFDRNELMDYAIRRFLEYRHLPDHSFGVGLLQEYLRRSFLSGTLQWDVLFESSYSFLFPNRKRVITPDLDESLIEALKEMELNHVPDPEELKKQFRKLMLRYHPDRNPNGQERSRRINASYTLLVASLF